MADNNQGTEDGVKKSITAIANFVRSLGKTILTFVKWIGTALGGLSTIVLPIVFVAVIIVCAIALVLSFFSGGYDPNSGLISSLGGVQGDKFYGTRFMYYDSEYTNSDLKDEYLEFTYKIINDVNGINAIGIDYTKPYNQSTQISSFCLTFASAINSDLVNPTLDECIASIDHYGLTAEESDLGFGKLAEALVPYASTKDEQTILTQLKESYNKTEFDYMRNVCTKILIKDYIVNEGETATNIPKKNYVGFVYMPKQQVIMNSLEFLCAVDENKQVDISAKYKSDDLFKEVTSDKADSTWFKNGLVDKTLECNLSEYILQQFTALDSSDINYLSNGKTLFDIFKDGKFNTFFKSGVNANDVTSLLENINTLNYFYLQMSADSSFNLAESSAEYK